MEGETETHADTEHDVRVHDSAADAAHHASELRDELEAEIDAEEERKAAVEETVKRPSAREELRRERLEAEASGGAPYGEGEDGYKRPRSRKDRMRKGTPYKVRRSLFKDRRRRTDVFCCVPAVQIPTDI